MLGIMNFTLPLWTAKTRSVASCGYPFDEYGTRRGMIKELLENGAWKYPELSSKNRDKYARFEPDIQVHRIELPRMTLT